MSIHGRIGRAGGTKVKRALGIQAALEWAFRIEKAQLELPPPSDIEEEGFGFGLEYVLLQRAALGCKVDGGQHKIGGHIHEDAEVIAATVAGMPDSLGGKRMAIRVAELARAGLTPDWMPGAVPRCVPVEVKRNQHGDPAFPATQLAMLAVKTSCKDRWRQVLAEADRISPKHLLTLEPAISEAQTNEMQASQLQLVLPAALHETYREPQQAWLMDLDCFLKLVDSKVPR